MNLQTFKAPTMAEALTQVKSTMGTDAVILHTRAPMGRSLLETPAATGAAMISISQEVAALKTMVRDLVVQTRQRQTPNIPDELFELYTKMVGNSVCEEIASEAIKSLQTQVRPEHYAQPEFVKDRLLDVLEKMVTTAGPIARTRTGRPHVVALIGPTGVGKTTTLAKLAANLKLKERHRVGLITLDTYRIAAVDQLKRYADIIGSPLRVVSGADDLRAATRSMHDCEV